MNTKPLSWLSSAFFLPAALCAHCLVWTLYGVIHQSGPLHPDMLEAYLWGQEFQLGYWKHPPFWAWLAGAWFAIFPASNWAFYLLSALTSGLGLIGAWKLYGLYARREHRLAATLLLLASPSYTLLALKFNANSILLLLWPWTAYFFALSMQKPSVRNGILFGIFAAAGLLSKYYTGVLLASCVCASLFHPGWRRYYRSWSPYVAVAVCVLLLIPHAIWLIQNDFTTLTYAESRTEFSDKATASAFFSFIFACLGFNSLMAILIISARRGHKETRPRAFERSLGYYIAILGLGPFGFSLVIGLLAHVRLSSNFAIPIFFLVPLFLLQRLRPNTDLIVKRSLATAAVVYALALPVALAAPHVMIGLKKQFSIIPAMEASRAAIRIWKEETKAPLATVAGSAPYAMTAAFYSRERTREFTAFNPKFAPWITPEWIAEHGLLSICLSTDGACNSRAADYATSETKIVAIAVRREALGDEARDINFLLYIRPPAPGTHLVSNK